MKPLLIGEAPSKNEPLPKPLEGRIGRRLAACAGLTFEQYLATFDRINLLDVRQDTAEHGFTFDRAAAAERARTIMATLEHGRIVLLLGKRVAAAVGAVKSYFEPHYLENGATLYVVPHPSGINRWWNLPENVQKMNAFMRGLIKQQEVVSGNGYSRAQGMSVRWPTVVYTKYIDGRITIREE